MISIITLGDVRAALLISLSITFIAIIIAYHKVIISSLKQWWKENICEELDPNDPHF